MTAQSLTEESQSRRRLRRVGEACLWALIIGVTVVAALNLAWTLRLVVLPFMLALVLATFLNPPVRFLKNRGWHDGLAAATVLLVGLLTVGGLMTLLIPPVVEEFRGFDVGIAAIADRMQEWIRDSPLPVSTDQINETIIRVEQTVTQSLDVIVGPAITGALVAIEMLIGIVLAVVILFFVLKDGNQMFRWAISLAPPAQRKDLYGIGQGAWKALGGFMLGQTLVALFDAVFIGIGLLVIGVPLALPLAVITFFGGYVPVIGATVAGFLAVMIALVSLGLAPALAVLALVLAVQQFEGNVLEPVIVGRAVDVHPVAILLGVTTGAVLAGVIGAMIAAPLVAVASAVLGYLRDMSSDEENEEEKTDERSPSTDAPSEDTGQEAAAVPVEAGSK